MDGPLWTKIPDIDYMIRQKVSDPDVNRLHLGEVTMELGSGRTTRQIENLAMGGFSSFWTQPTATHATFSTSSTGPT